MRYEVFGHPELIEAIRALFPQINIKDYPPFSANVALTEQAPIIFD
jgi:hypothetical protein